MIPRLFLPAVIMATALACNKADQDSIVSPPPVGGTKEVQLKLTGDITTSESPLGRRTGNTIQSARTLRDSTIYAVIVRNNGKDLYEGIFNQANSIILKIPDAGSFSVSVFAIKSGSGAGVFYTWYNGVQAFSFRPFHNLLTNQLNPVLGTVADVKDTLTYVTLFNGVDTSGPRFPIPIHAEADSYIGKATFDAATAPAVLSVPLRRVVFGIKYNAANFNSGRLLADFGGLMDAKAITPAEAPNKQYIYTADELRNGDSLYLNPVTVKLQWERPDGSVVILGQKKIAFKRNVLTNINLTIPAGTGVVNPFPTDTTWNGDENVNF